MFNEISEYVKLGIEHILDLNGLDHVLFLVVLAIPFVLKSWKKVIILATAFTVGHSITLILSGLDIIRIDSNLVEILIVVSIFITAIYNLIQSNNKQKNLTRYSAALFFGLIHGLGFSNFFRSIFGNDAILFPLFGFNLGVEVAQIIIVVGILLINKILIDFLKVPKKYWVNTVSVIIAIWSLKLILERI